MIALKIIFLLLGIAFTSFGYLIFFKKMYSLINGFGKAYKAGNKDEVYAQKVGLIEFSSGILLLVVSIILFILA